MANNAAIVSTYKMLNEIRSRVFYKTTITIYNDLAAQIECKSPMKETIPLQFKYVSCRYGLVNNYCRSSYLALFSPIKQNY